MGACVSAYINIYDEYSVDSRSVVRLRFDYLRTARKCLYRSAPAPSGFHSPPLEDCSSPSQTAFTASVDDRFLWTKIFIEALQRPPPRFNVHLRSDYLRTARNDTQTTP
jgi:hypothetical protein